MLELLDLRDRRERLEPRRLEIDPHVSAIVRGIVRVPFSDCGVATNVVLSTGATEVAVIARSEGLGRHARTVEVRTDERRARS